MSDYFDRPDVPIIPRAAREAILEAAERSGLDLETVAGRLLAPAILDRTDELGGTLAAWTQALAEANARAEEPDDAA